MMVAASMAVICGIVYWVIQTGDKQPRPEEWVTLHPEHRFAPIVSRQNGLKMAPKENSGDFGAQQAHAPIAPRGRPGEDIALPLVFRGSGAAESALNPHQQELVRRIQEDFATAISRAGEDSSSPEYQECWIKAKIVADSKLHQQLGAQGWLLYTRAQAQAEYSESNGTRAAPPER